MKRRRDEPKFAGISCGFSFFCILLGFSGTLLNVYPLDLGATEAQQGTVAILVDLASTFKIVFGFVSDNYPLYNGYRRKPYMLLGWLTTCTSMIVLLTFGGDLQMSYDNDTGMAIPPPDPPSMELLSACFVVFGIGFWMADVMGDTIVVCPSNWSCSSPIGARNVFWSLQFSHLYDRCLPCHNSFLCCCFDERPNGSVWNPKRLREHCSLPATHVVSLDS